MAFPKMLRELVSSGLRLAKGMGELLSGHETLRPFMMAMTTRVAVHIHWLQVRVASPGWKPSERRS